MMSEAASRGRLDWALLGAEEFDQAEGAIDALALRILEARQAGCAARIERAFQKHPLVPAIEVRVRRQDGEIRVDVRLHVQLPGQAARRVDMSTAASVFGPPPGSGAALLLAHAARPDFSTPLGRLSRREPMAMLALPHPRRALIARGLDAAGIAAALGWPEAASAIEAQACLHAAREPASPAGRASSL